MWLSTLPRRFGIILEKILDRHERSGIAVQWNGGGGVGGTYYYHLNMKEIDHIVFITKTVHVMFHETVSRKLLVFTLYVNPYMSNGNGFPF